MNVDEVHVELSSASLDEPVACSCTGVPFVPGSPSESLLLAAWVRREFGDGAEVCQHADGTVSFAREPGGKRTGVRVAK